MKARLIEKHLEIDEHIKTLKEKEKEKLLLMEKEGRKLRNYQPFKVDNYVDTFLT